MNRVCSSSIFILSSLYSWDSWMMRIQSTSPHSVVSWNYLDFSNMSLQRTSACNCKALYVDFACFVTIQISKAEKVLLHVSWWHPWEYPHLVDSPRGCIRSRPWLGSWNFEVCPILKFWVSLKSSNCQNFQTSQPLYRSAKTVSDHESSRRGMDQNSMFRSVWCLCLSSSLWCNIGGVWGLTPAARSPVIYGIG